MQITHQKDLKTSVNAVGGVLVKTTFDKSIGIIEPLKKDDIGIWFIDKEHKGTDDVLYNFRF